MSPEPRLAAPITVPISTGLATYLEVNPATDALYIKGVTRDLARGLRECDAIAVYLKGSGPRLVERGLPNIPSVIREVVVDVS